MDFAGERIIPADRASVWQALNNPEMLKRSIPGCEDLHKLSDTEFEAIILMKLGPVKARFKGQVKLSQINAPESYRLAGKGSGGVAGFGSGTAVVRLQEHSEGTLLTYSAEAQVGGKLAQLGSRLVRSAVMKLSGTFFDNFAKASGKNATRAMSAERGIESANMEVEGDV